MTVAHAVEFAALLKRYRVAAGLTQEELAERTGLSAKGISDLERGARAHPRRDTVILLAGALGLTDPERTALAAAARHQPAPQAPAEAPRVRAGLPDPLLATKLHWPRPRPGLVDRTRLLDRLHEGAHNAVTLISAPAGFGKSTLLAQWLSSSSWPVAWLSLEQGDNEPERFLAYVIAALRVIDPQLGATSLSQLGATQPAPVESVLILLANDIVARQTGDFFLVLDDYHVIDAEPIQRAMCFLVDHLPPQLHVVIATRADPPLSLARLRARGQLTELRAADLAFSTEETSAFLHTVLGLRLLPADIAAIERRTEGWIAGLQLAGLSLQGRTDVATFLASFTGSHRFILDYLSEEVLARQSETIQAFLLQTSILEQLCGPLCDAVTGLSDSQAVLERLDRANLFVISLDEERRWYRYRQLFADVLRRHLQRLQPSQVSVLHQRASAWYEQQGFAPEAIRHALAARDFEPAAHLIEQYAVSVIGQGRTTLVLEWTKALPDELVRRSPHLSMHYASALHLTDQLEAAETRLEDAERVLNTLPSAEDIRRLQGNAAVLRANFARFRGDLETYVTLGRAALDILPEEAVALRAVASTQAAHTFLVSGDLTSEREQEVHAAMAVAQASGYTLVCQRGLVTLARLQTLQGRMRDAAATYEETGRATPVAMQALSSTGPYYFGLGDILREWNRLDEARRSLLQGMEFIRGARSTFADDALAGYIALARLQQATGEYSEAIATMEAFGKLAETRHFVDSLRAQAAAVRAHLDLMQGNLAAAIRWADQRGLCLEQCDYAYQREREYLTLARVRIAQGRADAGGPMLQDVVATLNQLLNDAEARARLGSALEIRVLLTLALAAQGHRKQAVAMVGRALVQAAPEGYCRLFLDEGAPMLTLLRQAHDYGIAPDYVAGLLAAFGEPVAAGPKPATSPDVWIDPLTDREQEVLRLIATGASNGEIACRLVISLGTAKRHVSNICGKLGARSRTQAIARARALHLL